MRKDEKPWQSPRIIPESICDTFSCEITSSTSAPLPDTQTGASNTESDVLSSPSFHSEEVDSPPHYTEGGIETIDYLRAKLTKDQYLGYLRGNILKYTSRIGHKGHPIVDAGKIRWYAEEHERATREYYGYT